MRKFYQKLSDGKKAEANRKENEYSSSCVSGPFIDDAVGIQQGSEMNDAPTINRKQKRTKKEKQMVWCGHCGRMDHSRRTSFDCLKNPKNMLLVGAEDTKRVVTILCDIELSMYSLF
jgi:hypothetical protein